MSADPREGRRYQTPLTHSSFPDRPQRTFEMVLLLTELLYHVLRVMMGM